MSIRRRKLRMQVKSFFRHDLSASISVFFVALPLCLGISLASKAPLSAGLIAGIVGGLIIPLISKSPLSVSGPAAGLTAICATGITDLGAPEIFFIAVSIAGLLQLLIGVLKLGGFTHFIPSSVIKGMLAAIGLLLILKQIPFLIGYNKPDFWRQELVNLVTLSHGFDQIHNLYQLISAGPIIAALVGLLAGMLVKRKGGTFLKRIPPSFIIVVAGSSMAYFWSKLFPGMALRTDQFVSIPDNFLQHIHLTSFKAVFSNAAIWKYAVLLCMVASLETLLSIEAIDKLDPLNRITPQNRELVAQGSANFISGLVGGLPITSVIVRSSANAESGAKSSASAFSHAIFLLIAVILGISLINHIPYSVLAYILIRTGYNLAKPKMIANVYKQGREQFLPFLVTVIAILSTDLLIGVLIGLVYSIYFIMKHSYRAGYILKKEKQGSIYHFDISLALNVNFIHKKGFLMLLDSIPAYSVVKIDASDTVYIDHDILEIFQEFKNKARSKHIQLTMNNIRTVESIELH